MPGGGKRCQVKRNVRTDEPAAPAVARRLRPRQVARREPRLRRLICRVGRRFPRATPTVAKLVTGAAAERDVDRSQRPASSARRARCTSSRWSTACPSSTSPTPCASCARRRKRLPTPILFPIEVRVSAGRRHPAVDRVRADRRGGSPCTSTAARRTRSTSTLVERIMDGYGGRPHWGKLHGQRAATLRAAVPAVGRLPGGPRQARPRPHVRQPVPRTCPRLSAGRLTDPLTRRRVLEAAAAGSFPPADGARSSCCAPDPWGWSAIVALTGHAYVLADVDPDELRRRRRRRLRRGLAPRRAALVAGPRRRRSAPSTPCSSGAPRPGRCCHAATISTTTPGCAGARAPPRRRGRTATTTGSSCSVAAWSAGGSWRSSCSTRRPAAGPVTGGD